VFDAVIGKYMPYPVSYQYVPYDDSSESYDNLVSLVPEQVSTYTPSMTEHVECVCVLIEKLHSSVRTNGCRGRTSSSAT